MPRPWFGVTNYKAVRQTRGNTCWAAATASALKTFGENVGPPAEEERPFARRFWDNAPCPEATQRRGQDLNEGVDDLACVLDFARIHVPAAPSPIHLTQPALEAALKANRLVLCVRANEDLAHVVTIKQAAYGNRGRLWVKVQDPLQETEGIDRADDHLGEEAFVVAKPAPR